MANRTLAGLGRKLGLGRYRSAGIQVVADVHALIEAGNAARDRRDWAYAADRFHAALAAAPELVHIWIQYGHAEKEQGHVAAAIAAYEKAEAFGDPSGDAAFYLGRLARQNGDRRSARQHLLRGIRTNPKHPDAFGELRALIGRRMDLDDETIRLVMGATRPGAVGHRPIGPEMARLIASAPDLNSEQRETLESARLLLDSIERGVARSASAPSPAREAEEGLPTIVFDVSDLISYFRNARLPTGIQRVQIETISNALRRETGSVVRICCFTETDDDWIEIPAENFLELSALSVAAGDRTAPEWLTALNNLYLYLSIAPPFEFAEGAYLVNLGTSWWLQNYFLYVRDAQRTRNIRYVPFVHDFIPVMTPQHCIKELTEDFITWALGVYQHADFFLANSESTKRDLIAVGRMLGHLVAPDDVAVIPLDADFRRPGAAPLAADHLRRWYLKPGGYILFVSTIESRKNHALAFDAWIELIREHGIDAVPKLVCVGNRGWLNDRVYQQLEDTPALKQRIVMLSQLSDEELALLYRECLFTLYPSTYEGWGLPVTESLCYHKVPLISDSSSLPEAGGRFAVYFENGSLSAIVTALDALIFHPARRLALEREIALNFAPRSWTDIGNQIEQSIAIFDKRATPVDSTAPALVRGAYHPIRRNFERRIWPGMALGEIYRGDTGWWWPEAWGCSVKPDGGTLRFSIPWDGDVCRFYLQLAAPADGATHYEVYVEQTQVLRTGALDPERPNWVVLDLARQDEASSEFTVRIRGTRPLAPVATKDAIDDAVNNGDEQGTTLGVAGFFACAVDDHALRAGIIEAIALEDEMALAFNREFIASPRSVPNDHQKSV